MLTYSRFSSLKAQVWYVTYQLLSRGLQSWKYGTRIFIGNDEIYLNQYSVVDSIGAIFERLLDLNQYLD